MNDRPRMPAPAVSRALLACAAFALGACESRTTAPAAEPRAPAQGPGSTAPQPAPDAAAAGTPTDAPHADDAGASPTDAGAPATDAGPPTLGSSLSSLLDPPRTCGGERLDPASCATGPAAPKALAKAVELTLQKVAWLNSDVSSEWARVVRARKVRVWLAEDGGTTVRAAFDADTSGSYNDTRGGGRSISTGVTPVCVELDGKVRGDRSLLARPACVEGLGQVPDSLRTKD